MKPKTFALGELPDEILEWHGTAAELAEQCKTCLPRVGLASDTDAANERLIRHYVQMGVIGKPDPDGFGAQHVFDFLAARALLNDGWSLSKIAELRTARPHGLTSILPGPVTPAEIVVSRIKTEAAGSMRRSAPLRALEEAAQISERRKNLRTSLLALGNAGGGISRRRTLQLSLTPWCTVYVDAAELQKSSTPTLELIGKALTQALHEERIRRGE
jgi:hypothetical protein